MATIQIRDIPEEAYETIRRRARDEGKSIQSYMRDQIVQMASRRTKAEVMAAIEAVLERNPGPGISREDALRDLEADRR